MKMATRSHRFLTSDPMILGLWLLLSLFAFVRVVIPPVGYGPEDWLRVLAFTIAMASISLWVSFRFGPRVEGAVAGNVQHSFERPPSSQVADAIEQLSADGKYPLSDFLDSELESLNEQAKRTKVLSELRIGTGYDIFTMLAGDPFKGPILDVVHADEENVDSLIDTRSPVAYRNWVTHLSRGRVLRTLLVVDRWEALEYEPIRALAVSLSGKPELELRVVPKVEYLRIFNASKLNSQMSLGALTVFGRQYAAWRGNSANETVVMFDESRVSRLADSLDQVWHLAATDDLESFFPGLRTDPALESYRADEPLLPPIDLREQA